MVETTTLPAPNLPKFPLARYLKNQPDAVEDRVIYMHLKTLPMLPAPVKRSDLIPKRALMLGCCNHLKAQRLSIFLPILLVGTIRLS